MHSVLAFFMSSAYYGYTGGLNYNGKFNQVSIYIFGHSIGYFLYDMIFAELYGIHDWAMRLHHIGVLVGGTILYYTEIGGPFAITCLIVTEINNPCLLMRHIMTA